MGRSRLTQRTLAVLTQAIVGSDTDLDHASLDGHTAVLIHEGVASEVGQKRAAVRHLVTQGRRDA